jgi:glycolate oxidase
METRGLVERLQSILGADHVVYKPEDLIVFERDASIDAQLPAAVVFPRTTSEVSDILRVATEFKVPVVPKGAGTGLSGGAVPEENGILLSVSRMRDILEIDEVNRTALVEPGVVNLELSSEVEHLGLYYAPDPSSQKACTLGGNVAENSGGAHCLRYGCTINHVMGLEVVFPSGEVAWVGGKAPDAPGYDLVSAIIGSEGTMGVVTKILVKLLPVPEAVETYLAIFDSVPDSCEAVSAIIGNGIIPAALEIMDQVVTKAIEEAHHVGYPADAGSVLIVEIDGMQEELDEQRDAVLALCRQAGASEIRVAQTEEERETIWAGRKGAIGALGRLAPNYYIQDCVVPRTKLPEIMRFVEDVAARYDIIIANVFHAGDGNLHPNLLFDVRDSEQVQRVIAAGEEIIRACIDAGGSLSGEHGIGTEKQEYMAWLYSEEDLEAMRKMKRAFDPHWLFNPTKVFPTGDGPHAAKIHIGKAPIHATAAAVWK